MLSLDKIVNSQVLQSPANGDNLRHMSSLGHRVQRARKQRGMTLTALAEAVGVHPGTISNIESGRRGSDGGYTPLLMKIAGALMVRHEWLIKDEGTMERDAPVEDLPERAAAAAQAERDGVWREAIRSRLADPVSEVDAQMPAEWWLHQIKSREIEMIQEALRLHQARQTSRRSMPPASAASGASENESPVPPAISSVRPRIQPDDVPVLPPQPSEPKAVGNGESTPKGTKMRSRSGVNKPSKI